MLAYTFNVFAQTAEPGAPGIGDSLPLAIPTRAAAHALSETVKPLARIGEPCDNRKHEDLSHLRSPVCWLLLYLFPSFP